MAQVRSACARCSLPRRSGDRAGLRRCRRLPRRSQVVCQQMPTRRSICRRLIGMELCQAFAAPRQSACDTAAGTGVAGPVTGVAGSAAGATRRGDRGDAPYARRNASDTPTAPPGEARDSHSTRWRAVRSARRSAASGARIHMPFDGARHAGTCSAPCREARSTPADRRCAARKRVYGRHKPAARNRAHAVIDAVSWRDIVYTNAEAHAQVPPRRMHRTPSRKALSSAASVKECRGASCAGRWWRGTDRDRAQRR